MIDREGMGQKLRQTFSDCVWGSERYVYYDLLACKIDINYCNNATLALQVYVSTKKF